LLWMYLTALIVLVGAAYNAEARLISATATNPIKARVLSY